MFYGGHRSRLYYYYCYVFTNTTSHRRNGWLGSFSILNVTKNPCEASIACPIFISNDEEALLWFRPLFQATTYLH
ncbi:hypothetical protein IV203_009725 [Nitzschia inconspicua]|uniref:Uncharacterized protein n=1 Tax=Nitzschia inconspicua TaxID=303405 RepID=A0A9K3PK75_9STRA|nr:hypothetical protein IV203_009725 [Nitzschia inconspicua]